MIPVDQTTFGKGTGNCFQACVASIFELPLADVPNFCVDYDEDNWWPELEKWCAARGLAPLMLCFDRGEQTTDPARLQWLTTSNIAVIVSGISPRGIDHSVVCLGIGNPVWHDPHPSKAGLVSMRDIIAFVAIHPGKSVAA